MTYKSRHQGKPKKISDAHLIHRFFGQVAKAAFSMEDFIKGFERLRKINISQNKTMNAKEIKLLNLPLKAIWYDMQESGEKNEEYREITPYWCKRLLGRDTALFSHRYNYESCNVKGYTHVLFRYGYTKRAFTRKIDSITIGRGKPEWGAPTDRDVFIIKHHAE